MGARSTKSNGSWIQTFTGKQFFWAEPDPEDVDIEDIAHALSLLCIFNGHCRKFYSVAEHSVHVSTLVPRGFELMGLLHDASEAYFSDLPSPIKKGVTEIHEIEDRLHKAVFVKFGLNPSDIEIIKDADNLMLFTEKKALMSPEPAPWPGAVTPSNSIQIECWPPEKAKSRFLDRFSELTSQHR